MTFVKVPKVSYACRALISRILVPQRSRARIENIKQDPWLIVPTTSVQTSISSKSFVGSLKKIKKSDTEVLLAAQQMAIFDDKIHQGKSN